MKNRFENIFKFSNNDINKFILLLIKYIYSHESMDDLEKFNKISLPEKRKVFWTLRYGRYYRFRLYACKKSL